MKLFVSAMTCALFFALALSASHASNVVVGVNVVGVQQMNEQQQDALVAQLLVIVVILAAQQLMKAWRYDPKAPDSRDVVDATVTRAVAAGGRADPNPAQNHGFMFGRSVEDPDGNVWEIMWMDAAALGQTPA